MEFDSPTLPNSLIKIKIIMYKTNYYVATHWLHNSLVLCNNIAEADSSIWDNCRFNLFDEDDNPKEIYQYFITSCSEWDVEFLEKHFGLLFTYSELLDCYILCVDHWGTGWDYCYMETDLKNAEAEEGDTLGL